MLLEIVKGVQEVMNANSKYSLIAILIIAGITFAIRVAPFVLFGNNKTTPKYIAYIGNYLPPAVMSMLIIYCLRNVDVLNFPFGLPEAIGIITVAMLHIWKRNNLISILAGTAIYMISVQFVFI